MLFYSRGLIILLILCVAGAMGLFLQRSKAFQSGLRLVGPNNDTNPVVNEGNKLQLTVVDQAGQPISGARFESGSPEVASVDAQTGVVTGLQRGFATITATTPIGTVSNFISVARVTGTRGVRVRGDTKTDASGIVYLSDPVRNIILYRPRPDADAQIYAGLSGIRGLLNGSRTQAQFAGPVGVAVDNRPQGGIYIADALNNCIRRIDYTDQVTTFLGNGTQGVMTADTTAFQQAVFRNPQGVAVDSGGNVYIADTDNHAIYVADLQNRVVRLLAGNPGAAGNADGRGRTALFRNPTAIAVQQQAGAFGSSARPGLLVADTGNRRIRFVGFDGQVSTLGRSPAPGNRFHTLADSPEFDFQDLRSLSVDATGNIYVVDALGPRVITQPIGRERQLLSLAQPQVSFGAAASVVVRGYETLVVDSSSSSEADAVKVVTFGAPEISQLSIQSDSLSGGSELIVQGRNFAPESLVILGDRVVENFTVQSATSIRLITPAQSVPGNLTLSIITRGGITQRAFTYRSRAVSEIGDRQVTTIAGGVVFNGDGGEALKARVKFPQGLAFDSAGNLYISDSASHRIRRIDSFGIVNTIAGNGISEFGGDGAQAISASLSGPRGIAVDRAGNLFIADTVNCRVRRVDGRTGVITTVAGTGVAGFAGDGGQATQARLQFPYSVAVDSQGNLYIADTFNSRIRRVDARTGIINTIAGDGLLGYNGDNIPARNAHLFLISPLLNVGGAGAVAVDSQDNIFIADTGNCRIRRIDARTGIITTVAGNGQFTFNGFSGTATSIAISFPYGLSVDRSDNLIVVDTGNNLIRALDLRTSQISTIAGSRNQGFGGDGRSALSASLNTPTNALVDGSGNLFIADQANSVIRRVDASTGIISSILGADARNEIGDGGPAVAAVLQFPNDVAVDPSNNYLLTDSENQRVRRIDSAIGSISTVLGNGGTTSVGENGPAINAETNEPTSVASDRNGNVYVVDYVYNRILCISAATGIVRRIAGTGEFGFSGDGGSALQAKLGLNIFSGIATDSQNNVYFSDQLNHRIRRIDARTGIITTVAGSGATGVSNGGFGGDGGMATSARLNAPRGIAFDSEDNLYIADTGNSRVRAIEGRTGRIFTVAGNGRCCGAVENFISSTSASIDPVDVAIDGAGNLYIADVTHNMCRKVDVLTGIITTVAGNGLRGYSGDNGDATSASFGVISAVSVDRMGNIILVDALRYAVRVVKAAAAPTTERDYFLSISPISQTVEAGQSADYLLFIKVTGGFANLINLSFSGLPPGSSVPAFQGTSPLPFRVVTSLSTPPGSYTFTITGQGGGLVRSTQATIVVTPPTRRLVITSASYTKPILSINGEGFGAGVLVFVNGVDISSSITAILPNRIELRGNKKKLALRKGANEVFLVFGGTNSNTFTFQF